MFERLRSKGRNRMKGFRIFSAVMAVVLAAGCSCAAAKSEELTETRQEAEDFDFANGLLSRGMYDMAASAYGDFLRRYPESVYARDARYRKAEAYFLQKDNDKALAEFTQLLAGDISPAMAAEARLRIGQIKYASGKLEEARLMMEEALTTPGAEEQAIMAAEYYLAELLIKSGKRDEARKAFEAFIERYEQGSYSGFAAMNLGDIYMEEKEYGKAAATYAAAVPVLEETGLKAEADLREAEALKFSGEKEKALQKYREILSRYPEQEIKDRAALGEVSVNYGAGDNKAAIDSARALLPGMKVAEEICRVKFLLAGSYLNTDRFSEAREIYGEIDGQCASARMERRAKLNNSWAGYKLGLYEQCLKETGAYLNAYPEEEADEALYLRGKTLGAMNRWDEAIDEYDALLDKYADSMFRREALYDKGWACDRAGKTEAGLFAHREFIEEFPGDERSPGLLLKIAQERLQSKEYDQAIELYERFLAEYAKDPQRQFAMYQMARAFYEAGRYGDAIRTYDEILEDFPYSEITGNVFYWRAISYQKQENWDKAIMDFREAANKGGELAVKASEAVAFSLFQKGEEEEAADAYYAVISESIGTHAGIQKGIYLWTAEFYTARQENEKALEVLRSMEKAYPGASGPDVLYLFGENSRLTGKDKDAVEYFQKALAAGAASPRKERCYLGMGRALLKLGEKEKAIAALENALSGDRDNVTGAQARMEMGNIYSEDEDHAQAARQYAMVAILYDDKDLSPKALFMAAEAFKKAGSPGESEKLLRELQERFPDHPMAEQARQGTAADNDQDRT
jgi:TolA-binding protein